MTHADQAPLYSLLPAIYRLRDEERGRPLRALVALMEGQLADLEADIAGLYDNWFIETCDEWVVAYIGDLLGVRGLSDEQHLAHSQRARVANTISYRRRKGVAAVLERVVQDGTGWPARAVEFFELVGATQHIQHLRPARGGSADVRDLAALERMGGAFDRMPRRPDVRRVAVNRGRHNVTSVGIYLWRLQSYPLRAAAAPVEGRPGCYTFHPFGLDMPLFVRPQSRGDEIRPAEELNLPMPIGVGALAADLDAYRRRYAGVPAAIQPDESDYYGPERSLMVVRNGQPVKPGQLVSMSLEPWRQPGDATQIAIDPTLGRIALGSSPVDGGPPDSIDVAYSYGFSADLGGGPYDRRESLTEPSPELWVCIVARHLPEPEAGAPRVYTSLAAAVQAWQEQDFPGLIQIADSECYDLPAGAAIELARGGALVIQALDGVYPSVRQTGVRIIVRSPSRGGGLTLNGLRLNGAIVIAAGSGPLQLRLLHCVAPGGIAADKGTQGLQATVERSIVGALRLPADGATLTVRDSIIDSGSPGPAITGALANTFGPRATLERATIFGPVRLQELPMASEVIFTGPLTVQQRQTGGVRFSYVPDGSRTPPRYRCQPDMALAGRPDDERERRRLAPIFTSTRYGAPGYGQLALGCAPQIRAGAEDGSEMGAYHMLHQPQRAVSLLAALDEYLPAGLEAGLFYVT